MIKWIKRGQRREYSVPMMTTENLRSPQTRVFENHRQAPLEKTSGNGHAN